MVTVHHSLAVVLCLIYVPNITTAFLKRSVGHNRVGKSSGTQEGGDLRGGNLSFKGDELQPETATSRYTSIVLECAARGSPSPTIHWLKDGVKLVQDPSQVSNEDDDTYEEPVRSGERPALKMSSTHSRLYLDCLNDDDEATYTCVAENAFHRISQSTNLVIENPDDVLFSEVHECSEKRSNRGEPARIYMWTGNRLEFENTLVQLFCRAEGHPAPTITWFDNKNNPIENNDNYIIASNGDLIIRDVTFLDNMGTYTCVADNGIGSDTTQTFLYPTRRRN